MMDALEGQGEVDFPAWWQSKITTAKNMISGAKHYLEFELKEPTIDAMVDGIDDITPEMEIDVVDDIGEAKYTKRRERDEDSDYSPSYKTDPNFVPATIAAKLAKQLKSK